MSQFTEFLVAASSRVAFDGVHAASQIPDDLWVMRGLLQQQGLLVEGLENLLRAFEEYISKLISAIVRENAHHYASILL
ncbi:MAG: hypothetical protein ABSF69_29645 [Polyangiaceae bacterium]